MLLGGIELGGTKMVCADGKGAGTSCRRGSGLYGCDADRQDAL